MSFLELIKALEVAKNGRAKIIRIGVLACEIGSVSKIIKSTGK